MLDLRVFPLVCILNHHRSFLKGTRVVVAPLAASDFTPSSGALCPASATNLMQTNEQKKASSTQIMEKAYSSLKNRQ